MSSQNTLDIQNSENKVVITGVVEKVVFCNSSNGYAVLVIRSGRHEIMAVGQLFSLHVAMTVTVYGVWQEHDKFGRQLAVDHFEQSNPQDAVGIEKYLASGVLPGVGAGWAKKIVETFGEKTLHIISDSPDQLLKIKGFGQSRLELIKKSWQDQQANAQVFVFLRSHGITHSLANKIYRRYAFSTIQIINQDPYRLIKDIWGVGFKVADKIALQLKLQTDSPARIEAALIHVMRSTIEAGSVYIKATALFDQVLVLLEFGQDESLTQLLNRVFASLLLQEIFVEVSIDGCAYHTLKTCFITEKKIATKLKQLLTYASEVKISASKVYADLVNANQGTIQLSDLQIEGVTMALTNKITIITGGPGTGKTTILKSLIGQLKKHRTKFELVAPTGRAAKRMMEACGHQAQTLHRLLEFSPESLGFEKNEENCLQTDFLIVDECSMIDLFLFSALLKALPLKLHLVLVGDIDQLESVGPGKIFSDLIESNLIPTVRLKQIFRQHEESLIVKNAHNINEGKFVIKPSLQTRKPDFDFVAMDDPASFSDFLRHAYNHILPEYKIDPQDAIVLCPMHKSIVGTQKINSDLQQICNRDAQDRFMYFATQFRVQDRVMQIKNNYDKVIFNGDIGSIVQIDAENKSLKVDFSGKVVSYQNNELNELTLAYSISVHKSQGSEFSAVIIPIFTQHYLMLRRNVLYTAITRAKKLCLVVGQKRALAMAIKNDKRAERVTMLKDLLVQSEIVS